MSRFARWWRGPLPDVRTGYEHFRESDVVSERHRFGPARLDLRGRIHRRPPMTRWWRGPLSIDQLNLIAWHRLLADERITSYVVTDDGVIIYRPVLPRAWYRLGRAFVQVTVSAQRMTETFSRMVEALQVSGGVDG